MGWVSSIVRRVKKHLFWVPAILKKQVLRSRPVRSILARQLGKGLTNILEIHLLAVCGVGCKWVLAWALTTPILHQPRAGAGADLIQLVGEWAVDILVPVMFALRWHSHFSDWIYWTFKTPLRSLAYKIQHMRPNDLAQYFRVKYGILVPILCYLGFVVTFIPLSPAFIQICLIQTLLIHLIQDFWPLRRFCRAPAGASTLASSPPVTAPRPAESPKAPCPIESPKARWITSSPKAPWRPIVQAHIPLGAAADPFQNVTFD